MKTTKMQKEMCIMCYKRKKKIGSLFCKICGRTGIFKKIIALKKSEDYKKGLLNRGEQHFGRLPTRQEREWEK